MTKEYKSYQKGQLPWIHRIPEHWRWVRNGSLLYKKKVIVGKKYSDYNLLSLTTNGIRQKDINDVKGKVPESYDNYQKVDYGDMVFCLFDLDCSAVFSGLSNEHGMITSAYDVAQINNSIVNSQFLSYWFDSVFAGRYYKIFSRTVRYTVNFDSFTSIKSPVPSRKEQDQIVRFLDWKISEMNHFINEKRKEITKLEELKQTIISNYVFHGLVSDTEYKDTGYHWIPSIPEHWRLLRNKCIFHERVAYSVSGKETLLSVSKHYGVKRYCDLKADEQFATIKPAESLAGYKIVKKHDLVMNIMRARNGSYGISDFDGIVSPAYCVYSLNDFCDPAYMHYLLRTPQIMAIFEAYAYGIAEHRRRLYAEDFLRICSPVPPREEQVEIAKKCKEQEKHIDELIANIRKVIDLVKELKTRTISDVVTGQVDVRDVVIPEYTKEEEIQEDSDNDPEEETEEV